MKNCSLTLLCLAFFCGTRASAQATPAATRSAGELRVGLAYSNANSDEVTKRIGGATVWASYGLLPHFALEADVHLLQFQTPQDFAERSYVAGGRFFYRKSRYEPYVKVMGGIADAVAQLPYQNSLPGANDKFGILELGGGLDIRLSHRVVVRAIDYDYQHWGNFQPDGLTPTIFSFGVAYQILR